MALTNRLIAALITLVIAAIITTFAYGYYMALLEQYFSFSLGSLIVKLILALGLLIIVFFGRPRSSTHRVFFGAVATLAICFGAYGAFTGTLLLGDALIILAGSIVTVVEAVEDGLSRSTRQPITSLPSKSKAQL